VTAKGPSVFSVETLKGMFLPFLYTLETGFLTPEVASSVFLLITTHSEFTPQVGMGAAERKILIRLNKTGFIFCECITSMTEYKGFVNLRARKTHQSLQGQIRKSIY